MALTQNRRHQYNAGFNVILKYRVINTTLSPLHFRIFGFSIFAFYYFSISVFFNFSISLFLDFRILLFLDFCILTSKFPSQGREAGS